MTLKISFKPTLILVMMLFCTGFAQNVNAANSRSQRPEFGLLEEKVWLAAQHNFHDIEQVIVKALQLDSGSARYHYLLSQLYVRRYSNSPADLSLLKKASDLAQQAIDLAPSEEYGYVVIAEVLDIMGQTPNALKMLDPGYNPSLKPGWRTYFLKAKLRSDKLSNKDVLITLEKAMRSPGALHGVISPYVIAVVNTETSQKRIQNILTHWDQIFPNPLFKEALALSLAKQKKYHQAHNLYVQLYRPHFDRPEALLNDAILLHRDLKKSRQAEALLLHITGRLKKKATASTLAAAYTNLGMIQLETGQLRAAESSFVESLILGQNRYEVLDEITKVFRKKKKFHAFIRLIRRLNNEIPGSGVLYALLGETLSEDLGNHDQALLAFSDAIVLEPKRSDFYNGMGLTYYRKKEMQKALLVFGQASKLDPDDAIAKYNIACVLSRMGKPTESILALKEAVSLDPRLLDNARNDSDFDSVRTHEAFADIFSQGQPTEKIAH